MRVRFFSQRMSIMAATSRMPASTMRLTPPRADQRGQAVGDQQHDQRADQRLGDRALAAAEGDAAEHGRRQHDHLEADADVAADGAEPRREEQRADRGQHAAGDVAERDRAPHRNAGIVGRAARAADRGDVPARPQPGQEDVAEDRDDDIDERHARNAEDAAAADEIPGRDVGEGRRDRVGVVAGSADRRPSGR